MFLSNYNKMENEKDGRYSKKKTTTFFSFMYEFKTLNLIISQFSLWENLNFKRFTILEA